MKEEVVDKFMSKMLEYLSNTEVFLKEQAPDYINQLLEYEFYEGTIGLIVMGLFILFSIILIGLAFAFKDKEFGECCGGFGLFFCIVSLILICTVGVGSVKKMVKIKYAPKVFIVDYIRNYGR